MWFEIAANGDKSVYKLCPLVFVTKNLNWERKMVFQNSNSKMEKKIKGRIYVFK